ncbi:hypothetical protein LCGC14_0752390 [marine sediment metagenome]|uniref:Uncharacterized protein n=1 Tax=marine sediment metagenome TaxID=412755 RepID=A0A0F9Q7T6_9ZZZZ
MKPKHVWIIEYGTGSEWNPDSDHDGDFTIFFVKRDAVEHMKKNHTGHPTNLRVRKYMREEK